MVSIIISLIVTGISMLFFVNAETGLCILLVAALFEIVSLGLKFNDLVQQLSTRKSGEKHPLCYVCVFLHPDGDIDHVFSWARRADAKAYIEGNGYTGGVQDGLIFHASHPDGRTAEIHDDLLRGHYCEV